MLLKSYLILLGLLFIFSMIALLKKVHFRGYDVPARVCYDLLIVNEIVLAMGAWHRSFVTAIIMLAVLLFLIGLLETGFRNKLQNRMSQQLLWVIILAFAVNLILAFLMIK